MTAALCWRGCTSGRPAMAHLQLELRHIAGVLAVVAAVVRARRDLVDHQLPSCSTKNSTHSTPT
jgi:hypothetical protein